MTALLNNLLKDEAGFILSAELVLIATLGVIALIVGLSEVAFNINNELQDIGSAFGSINQSYSVQGNGGMGGSSYSNHSHMGGDIMAGGSMGEQ